MKRNIKEFIIEKINKLGEIKEEYQIQEIVESVRNIFKTKCEYFYAGGFDSPGYDIDCYTIAFLDDKGDIQGVSVNIERY